MKRYLNADEKTELFTLGAFHTFFEDRIPRWEKYNVNKEFMKVVRLLRTYSIKAASIMLKNIDPIEVNKVVKEIQKLELVSKYRNQAMREHDEVIKSNEMTHLKTDDFMDVVTHAMNFCVNCGKLGQESTDCSLRRIWIENDIPVYDCEAPEGKCPYQYKE